MLHTFVAELIIEEIAQFAFVGKEDQTAYDAMGLPPYYCLRSSKKIN